jgi:transmembrane sensor
MSDLPDQHPVNDEAIEAVAAAWLVQEEEGLTPEEAAAFARWREADPRHAAAVAMLLETCGILEQMPLARSKLEPEDAHLASPVLNRQHPLGWRQASLPVGAESRQAAPRLARGPELTERGTPAITYGAEHGTSDRTSRIVRFPFSTGVKIAVAIAACVMFAFVFFKQRAGRTTFENTYATTKGGYLRMSLPDASVLELNADSKVRVRFTARERRLVLSHGEAHFTVAKDPDQPFIVSASHLAVRAVGTAFNVRIDRKAVEVLVTEGRVRLGRASAEAEPDFSATIAPEMSAGQSVRFASGPVLPNAAPTITDLTPTAIRTELSWQLPRLVFSETPLASVVDQFNERNRVQLEIGDAELARRPVGGTFRADHVETFVTLLEKSGDITVERPSAHRIVLRKAEAPPAR